MITTELEIKGKLRIMFDMDNEMITIIDLRTNTLVTLSFSQFDSIKKVLNRNKKEV